MREDALATCGTVPDVRPSQHEDEGARRGSTIVTHLRKQMLTTVSPSTIP